MDTPKTLEERKVEALERIADTLEFLVQYDEGPLDKIRMELTRFVEAAIVNDNNSRTDSGESVQICSGDY
jgi:hypothetical protein